MNTIQHGGGVCTVPGLLTRTECEALIEDSERSGFADATLASDHGDVIDAQYRNNGRVILDDPALAAWLFERAAPHLPQEVGGWALRGLNERIRFYRYQPGQEFKWHKDGTFRRNETEESYLTFMVYLNEDFEGGETQFTWESVKPSQGTALFFPHRLTHRGAPVTTGRKYVIRSDVMYRQPQDQ